MNELCNVINERLGVLESKINDSFKLEDGINKAVCKLECISIIQGLGQLVKYLYEDELLTREKTMFYLNHLIQMKDVISTK